MVMGTFDKMPSLLYRYHSCGISKLLSNSSAQPYASNFRRRWRLRWIHSSVLFDSISYPLHNLVMDYCSHCFGKQKDLLLLHPGMHASHTGMP